MFSFTFPFFRQLEESDCGPVCLKMIASFYKSDIDIAWIKSKFQITKLGVSIIEIEEISKELGFEAVSVKTTMAYLKEEKPIPCILLLGQEHFVVLYKVSTAKRGKPFFYIADPAYGVIKLTEEKFREMWASDASTGIALFLQPLSKFYEYNHKAGKKPFHNSWIFIKKYLTPYKKYLVYVSFFLAITTTISWIFPAMIQKMIDNGIALKNRNIVWTVLFLQAALIIGQALSEWCRSLFSVKLSMQLSSAIISEFVNKLVRLPIRFFDYRTHSDIIQRIEDHSRIESFLTNTFIQNIVQVITYIVFSVILFAYSIKLFLIFNLLTALSVIGVIYFLKRIKQVNYNQFKLNFEYKNRLYEFINGMVEIRLNVAQKNRVGNLNNIITKLFIENTKYRNLIQRQLLLIRTINLFKNLFITTLCAYWVIGKQLDFGVMLSISFMIGFLNNSIESIVDFFRSFQDAKLAIERMDEIFTREDEITQFNNLKKVKDVHEIVVKNVSFKYPGTYSPFVFNDISLNIPKGKITAIVGASGSGKTTLLKLLISYYLPTNGEIYVGDTKLEKMDSDNWRKNCGIVMQSGYIFSASIEENISLVNNTIDYTLLEKACEIACIKESILAMPHKYKTKIGESGISLSGGQIQRLLIARAIYKNPKFIFFDEATSSLDANNERQIMKNLNNFFINKTVVIIAHRLSTVKNADQIIVLDNGKIAEIGNHQTLTKKRSKYYELVKNQLELGN